MWNPAAWIEDHKFTFVLVSIVIATIIAFPVVVYAPGWVSTPYLLVLFASPIASVIWFFRSM